MVKLHARRNFHAKKLPRKNFEETFQDKGKPVERQGRKATGPSTRWMAAWLPKEKFLFFLKVAKEVFLLRWTGT